MKRLHMTTHEPEIGRWYRVTSGPQRGRAGVCDLISDYQVGRRYRLANESGIVGRFPAEDMTPTAAPVYESKVAPETTRRAMDILMGKGGAS